MARRRLLSQLVCLRLRWMMLVAGVGWGTLLVMPNPFLPQGKLKIGYHTVMAQEAAKSAGDVPKTAEQQFKNIQVLKGVPAEQVMPTM